MTPLGPALERHVARFGCATWMAVTDAGFASPAKRAGRAGPGRGPAPHQPGSSVPIGARKEERPESPSPSTFHPRVYAVASTYSHRRVANVSSMIAFWLKSCGTARFLSVFCPRMDLDAAFVLCVLEGAAVTRCV
jgi:hypothetical protein